MDWVGNTIVLIGLVAMLLLPACVLLLGAATIFADWRSMRPTHKLKKFPLSWIFVVTAAVGAGQAARETVSFPISTIAILIGYATVRLFVMEILATTNRGADQSLVRDFARRSHPEQLDQVALENRKGEKRGRPRLKWRLKVPRVIGRNVRLPLQD